MDLTFYNPFLGSNLMYLIKIVLGKFQWVDLNYTGFRTTSRKVRWCSRFTSSSEGWIQTLKNLFYLPSNVVTSPLLIILMAVSLSTNLRLPSDAICGLYGEVICAFTPLPSQFGKSASSREQSPNITIKQTVLPNPKYGINAYLHTFFNTKVKLWDHLPQRHNSIRFSITSPSDMLIPWEWLSRSDNRPSGKVGSGSGNAL